MMKRKYISRLTVPVLLLILILAAAFCTACAEEEECPRWTLASGVTAQFSDNGRYGYILTAEGTGKIPDYASAKDTPWYGRSGRVTDIVIKEGITAVGRNAFKECRANAVVLPESVTAVGENAFHAQTLICSFTQVAAAGASVYLYSESQPSESGSFWHYEDGEITVWEFEEDKPTKVLFIGNSFTFYNDVPALFRQIAAGAGKEVAVESVTQGSWTLTKFADETDEYGKQVAAKLRASDDYDAVILQEQSARPLKNYSGFLSAAKALRDKINATQRDCKIYLYATWGYKDEADSRNMTIPEMEAALRAKYDEVAAEIGATVSPVGAAFSAVYAAHKDVNDNYYLDPDAYKNSPEREYALYFAADNKHPSYSGSFLSASVHVAAVLGIDPRTSDFTGELGADAASALKDAAYKAVFGS